MLNHLDDPNRVELIKTLLPEEEHHRVDEYIKLKEMRDSADGHTKCPMCHEQLYWCDCIAWEASELLEMALGILGEHAE